MAALLDTVANEEHPIVEGELPFFGFRFEGVVPPVAPRATAAIRKHSSQVRTLDDYVGEHRLSPSHAETLREAVRERLNIIVTEREMAALVRQFSSSIRQGPVLHIPSDCTF